MNITTQSIDKAAFYMTFNGELIKMEGHYPQTKFYVKTTKWIHAWYIIGGWVPYNRFCNERVKLKRSSRAASGLPERFTGNKIKGEKFGDIAIVRRFTKTERDRMVD